MHLVVLELFFFRDGEGICLVQSAGLLDSRCRMNDSCFVDRLVHQDSTLVQDYRSSRSFFVGRISKRWLHPQLSPEFAQVGREGRQRVAVWYEVKPFWTRCMNSRRC